MSTEENTAPDVPQWHVVGDWFDESNLDMGADGRRMGRLFL